MEYPQDEDLPEVEEPPSKRARVEEVVDEDLEAGGLPKQPFRAYENAEAVRQATKGTGETLFERIQLEQSAGGYSSQWGPFADEEEWELAHWVVTEGLSQGAVDRYLKLAIVS